MVLNTAGLKVEFLSCGHPDISHGIIKMREEYFSEVALKINIFLLFLFIFIAPQSFAYIKAPFLLIAIIMIFFGILVKRYTINNFLFLAYYVFFTFFTITWSFIGTLQGGDAQGIVESIRVYVIFMWIWAILTIYISNKNYEKQIDRIFVFSAIGISFLCFLTIIDAMYDLSLFSEFIKDEMLLEVGIHEGYVQLNNVNVGMFCFIIPYITSRLITGVEENRGMLRISLIISLIALILASRRIIMALFFLVPAMVYLISAVTDSNSRIIGKNVAKFYGLILFSAFVFIFSYYYYDQLMFENYLLRIKEIFTTDNDSPRQLQHISLLNGFYENPILGSGFGGLTDSIRSDERPWTYELTYQKLLFNSGLLGILLLSSFYIFYIFSVFKKIRNSSVHKSIYISLLVGFFCVLIATASNPYLSSFDFIFALSIIPLILNSRELC